MISLQEPSSPYTLDLGYGIQVTVKPLTTSSMLIAQANARQKAEKHQHQADEQKTYGLDGSSDTDDKEESENPALYQLYLLQELARNHIIDWQGVSFEGKPAPLTPANINAVMELYPVGEKFLAEFILKQMLLNSAKKDYGLFAGGITPKAEGPTIAKDATKAADNQSNALTSNSPPKQ